MGWRWGLCRVSSLKQTILMEAKLSVSQLKGGILYKQAAKMDCWLEEVLHKQAVLTKAKIG